MNKKPTFNRPDWDKLIPEAKDGFRCGQCNEMKTWQEQWQVTVPKRSREISGCDVCTGCKEELEARYRDGAK